MSNARIKELLGQLQDEIGGTSINEETRSLLRALESDIDDLLEGADNDSGENSVLDRAQRLESSFAASHPLAERIIRELVEVLGKMGV